MTHRVAVFGGGVGGMTAAHELVRVGKQKVEVTVYERNPVVGGKARSMGKAALGGGGQPLPGEHGFRFFPGYYQHVIKTMERIPYPAGGPGAVVAENLVTAPETHFARTDGEAIELANQFPRSIRDIANLFSFGGEVDIPFDDALRFAKRLRNLMCACDDRRYFEYEHQSWFDFVGAGESDSDDFKKYLADGLNQRTVAASGQEVSARTVGLTLIRIMNDWLSGNCIDRVLNGPTSERWLEPWRDHMISKGVTFQLDRTLVSLDWDEDDGIQSATVQDASGASHTVAADSYIVALPLADARKVFDASDMLDTTATGLHGLALTADPVLTDDWMNGLQLYLDAQLDLAAGHTIFVDSPFSLTSISQRQFWDDIDFGTLGDGTVKDILSIDVSDWNRECSCHGRAAKYMTREEIKDEVLAQVQAHIATSYPDDTMPNVVDWHLDPAIVEIPGAAPGEICVENREGLFINRTSSWDSRPYAVLRDGGGLDNLYLASDYVRTETDLATMEGANEAGRRAARGVLRQMGEPATTCERVELYTFPEPDMFKVFRMADDVLFNSPGPTPVPGPQPLFGTIPAAGGGPSLPATDAPPEQAVDSLPEAW